MRWRSMNSHITEPIGCVVWVVVAILVVSSVKYCSREESSHDLTCRIRWTHVDSTAKDSIRVAGFCGTSGLKR